LRIFLSIILGTALLASCSAPPPHSRYERSEDAAPLRPISAEQVADAVPRPDPLLAAGNRSPYSVNGVTYEILQDYRGYSEQGVASWYGAKFDGYETSNGETFDLYLATAAHKTLPIPSYARVTNLENGREVVVRVNDRGPFHEKRLIDLSYAAAVKLGYMEQGTARVSVEVIDVAGVDDRRQAGAGDYRYLQLGAFGSRASAQKLQGQVQALLSEPVTVTEVQVPDGLLYRVRVGPLDGAGRLPAVQELLLARGYPGGQPLP
jgi:rare lipoprotein A